MSLPCPSFAECSQLRGVGLTRPQLLILSFGPDTPFSRLEHATHVPDSAALRVGCGDSTFEVRGQDSGPNGRDRRRYQELQDRNAGEVILVRR